MTASEQVKIWESKNKATLDGLNAELRTAVDGVTKALSGVSVEPKKKPSKDELAKKFLEKYGQQKLKLDDEKPADKFYLSSIKIEWNEWEEGGMDFAGTVYKNLIDFKEALYQIGVPEREELYNKVKFIATWDNGKSITDRLDLGKSVNDFNPVKKSIKLYMGDRQGAMYRSDRDGIDVKAGKYIFDFKQSKKVKKEEAKKPDETGRTDYTLDEFIRKVWTVFAMENEDKLIEVRQKAFTNKYKSNIKESYEQDYSPTPAALKLGFQVKIDDLDALAAKQTASDILKKYKR